MHDPVLDERDQPDEQDPNEGGDEDRCIELGGTDAELLREGQQRPAEPGLEAGGELADQAPR